MSRRFELPYLPEIPAFDDDPTLFDPEPDWVADLEPPTRDDIEQYDGLGLRSVIAQPEALSRAWRRTTREEKSRKVARARVRRRKSSEAA